MKPRTWFPFLLLFLLAGPAAAQEALLRVRVSAAGEPLADARVSGGPLSVRTTASGMAELRLRPGTYVVRVSREGYAAVAREVYLPAGGAILLEVSLEESVVEGEAIVVTTTRGQRRLEDEAVRVEVVSREEVLEKTLMTPSDVAMLLNETSGVRVQGGSAVLGGAGIRIQGLPGRYTQLLQDGLPLSGTQPTLLGPLQLTPLDLQQVEVIKGASSALYGPGALGGVVNLVARRPDGTREALYNEGTRGATDALLWWSGPALPRSYTFTAGAHAQDREDVDGDAWADIASYRRVLLRPRAFWRSERGDAVLLTAGGSWEQREGGTLRGKQLESGLSYEERQQTRHADAGLNGRWVLREQLHAGVRASLERERYERRLSTTRGTESGARSTALLEGTLAGVYGAHQWLAGVAVQRESLAAYDLPQHDFRYTTPSLFLQDEFTPWHVLVLAGSARADRHSEYGTFVTPRLSVLYRPAPWSVRLSLAGGYFAPTPFTEVTEATGLRRLRPLERLQAERARSTALDAGVQLGALELNASAFAATVSHPLQSLVPAANQLAVVNAPSPLRTWGGEVFARWHAGPLHLNASYAHTRASEADPDSAGRRRAVPLTPRHSAGLVGAGELAGRGRIAAEAYYIGRQTLADNPYRTESKPYLLTGLLVEVRVRRVRLFLNGENLGDVRQTRTDPLVRQTRSREGLWTTDVWAPLEGRVVNGGVRIVF